MDRLLSGESRGGVGRLVAGHNPFYLLSALSMLLGCWTLSRALAPEPGHAGKLVLLIGVLNLYEALVIGLSLFLVRRGLARDGRTLLWLETVFLVDATFLGSELFASDLRLGAVVALGLALLAVMKVGLVVRALGLRLDRGLGLGLAAVGLVLAVPGVFAALAQQGWLTLPVVSLLWWLPAVVLVAQTVVDGGSSGWEATGSRDGVGEGLRHALRVLPVASLALHLFAAGWVQGVAFHPSLLGPLFLAFGARRLLRERSAAAVKASLLWSAAAILVSATAPSSLLVTGFGEVVISPLRSSLVMVGLMYLVVLRLYRNIAVMLAAGMCLVAAMAGHSLSGIAHTLLTALVDVLSWPARLVPPTATGWGALTVGLSFILLALGAWWSMRRTGGAGPS